VTEGLWVVLSFADAIPVIMIMAAAPKASFFIRDYVKLVNCFVSAKLQKNMILHRAVG
jgi:hypothetical protein